MLYVLHLFAIYHVDIHTLAFCQQGKVFSTVFSPDDPLTLAAAGSKAKLQIWDVGANIGARKVFGAKLHEAGRVLREKEAREDGGIVGVSDDESEDDGRYD